MTVTKISPDIKIVGKDVPLFSPVGYNTAETSWFTVFILLFQTTSRSVCEYLFSARGDFQMLGFIESSWEFGNSEIQFQALVYFVYLLLCLLLHFRTSQAKLFWSRNSFCANMRKKERSSAGRDLQWSSSPTAGNYGNVSLNQFLGKTYAPHPAFEVHHLSSRC